MSDDIAKLKSERAATREKRGAYVDANRGNLDSATMAELDAAVEAADQAAYTARRASADRLAALSPAEYAAARKRFLDEHEYAAHLRRQRGF